MAQPPDTDADASSGSVRVHASLPGPGRRGWRATLLSLALHLLLISLALRLTASAVLPEHSPIGDAIRLSLGGGGGGQRGVAMQQPAATPPPPPTVAAAPVVTHPPPVPTVIPPLPAHLAPPAAAAPAPAAAAVAPGAGSGTGSGGGAGSGTGSGEGPGSGSGKGGGTGGGNGGFPPESKQMVIPPLEGVPKELRGKSVEVTFLVTAAGLVSGLKIAPPIANKDFSGKFDEIMRGYTFKPARDPAGNTIAGVFVVTVTFGNK